MTRLSVLIPDGTINYITNPACRYDTTGWNAQGSTLTRSLERARFGIASLKVVTTGSSAREGAYFRVSALAGVSESITVSAYVRGTGKVRIRLDNNVVGGTEYASQRIDLASDRWTRISITGFSTGGDDLRLFVETDEDIPTTRTFYVDGAQMERKAYPTTYCDGDQPGCRWDGTGHGSRSERGAYTRQGGRWVELAKDRQEEDLYFTLAGGLGVAPTALDTREFTISPGGFVTNRKIQPRLVTITFHAKHATGDTPVSLARLHELRGLLIDVLNVDAGRQEDVWFCYDDGLPLYFQARYDGGLEGDWDIRNQFVNSFPVRLLCLDPYMVEDGREVQDLDFQETRGAGDISEAVGRINGEWNNMNYGMNNSVADFELGPQGELYAVGAFDVVNYSGDAVDPLRPTYYITYWDGTQWHAISVGTTGTEINDVAIAANGDVYVAGFFSTIGGVAANNIARWDGTQWYALGAGLDLDGIHIAIDAFGIVYAGGSFSTAGGVAAERIAKWNGYQWIAIGQFSGLNDDVYSIAVTPDGKTLYVAGKFTDQNGLAGNALLHVARYDVETDRFSAIGSGFNANVLEILYKDGILYACGDFTASGSTTISHVARFQGETWEAMGSGINGVVHSIDIGPNNDIVAVGEFEDVGGLQARGVAIWNGSTWSNLDIDINVGSTNFIPLAVQYSANGDIHIGGAGFYQLHTTHSAINYVENIGSADSSPVLYILGPGRMRWLENQTTGKRIFFNLTVLEDEEVVIDFGAGTILSTRRGSILHAVSPGSDFRAFTLAPGENKLAVYMTDDVEASVQMSYVPTHWGADAVKESVI